LGEKGDATILRGVANKSIVFGGGGRSPVGKKENAPCSKGKMAVSGEEITSCSKERTAEGKRGANALAKEDFREGRKKGIGLDQGQKGRKKEKCRLHPRNQEKF